MSDRDATSSAADRPRLAEALASLKEGLRDTADPFYDSWKVQRPADPVPVRLDATPPPKATEIVFGGPTIEEAAPFVRPIDAPPAPIRSSVPTDTVRVRVVRYRAFPTWAIVVAAALVVFSASLFALRTSLPMISGPGVLANEVVPQAQDPDSPSGTVAPFAHATGQPRPGETTEDHIAPNVDDSAGQPAWASDDLAAAAVPSAVPAGKLGGSPQRRRSHPPGFFRDPGF